MGADINAEDVKNRKPIDIAIHKKNSNIIELLKDQSSLMVCNLKQYTDSWTYPFTFFIFTFLLDFITLCFVLPHLNSLYKYNLTLSISALLYIIYLRLYFSDPGYSYSKLNKSLYKLALEGEILNKICPWCVIHTRPTLKHCYMCNRCVEDFDHHCIWLKNCIGAKNFYYFYAFILFLFIKLFFAVFFSFESNFILAYILYLYI